MLLSKQVKICIHRYSENEQLFDFVVFLKKEKKIAEIFKSKMNSIHTWTLFKPVMHCLNFLWISNNLSDEV